MSKNADLTELVAELLALDADLQAAVKTQWQELMHIAVWGELKSANVGAVPKLRKRALDVGEKWRSLFNDRMWIPQPRERLKNALGSALALHDAQQLLIGTAGLFDGGADHGALRHILALLSESEKQLREKENRWAQALQEINKDSSDA